MKEQDKMKTPSNFTNSNLQHNQAIIFTEMLLIIAKNVLL